MRWYGVCVLGWTKLYSAHSYFDESQDYLRLKISISGFSLPLEEFVNEGVKQGNWGIVSQISWTHPGQYVRPGLVFSMAEEYYCNYLPIQIWVQRYIDALRHDLR